MSYHNRVIDLGLQDLKLKNSPILSSVKDEQSLIDSEIPEERCCYFNGERFEHGISISSDGSALYCDRGVWLVKS